MASHKITHLNLDTLRPTKQIVAVLRKYGRMNKRSLWDRLVEEGTTIQSKTKAKFLLNWLWERNRVQIHVVTKKEAKEMNKAKRWEFTVNEENETKAESKLKEKYKYPKYKVRDEDASQRHKEEAEIF